MYRPILRITMREQLRILLLSIALILGACQSVDKAEHKLDVTEQDWQNKDLHSTEGKSPKETEKFNWLDDFNDDALKQLVEKALKKNFSLKAASERLKAFEARYQITRANNKPDLNLGLSSTRRRQKLNNGKTDISSSYELGFTSRWELDLWGRLEALNLKAGSEYEATIADLDAVRLSLAASISRAWFEALSLSEQVRLTQESLKTFEKSQEIIEERYQRGIITALDVHLGRTNLANAKRELLVTQKAHEETIRGLKILLGEYPSHTLKGQPELPALAQSVIPIGLPANLIERRPDLVAARKRLDATFYENENVKKNLLPSLSITGRFGTASDKFEDLLDADRLIGSLTGELIQPLFNSGKLKAEQKQKIAEYQEELAEYSETVLNAFLEVENSLAAESSLKKQEHVQEKATRESSAAEELALDQYSNGVEDIITLLTAQRSTLTAKIRLAELKKSRLQNRVAIYLAIGGEFQINTQDKK